MTKNKGNKIIELVEKVEVLSKYCVKGTATKSVVVSMLYSLFFASRELLYFVDSMFEELTNSIVDEYKIDYKVLRKKINSCMEDIEPASDEEEIDEIKRYDIKNAGLKIDEEEDKGYDFGNCDDFDVKNVNEVLLKNMFDIQNNVYGTLKNIKEKLTIIVKEHDVFEEEYNQPGTELLDFGLVLKARFVRMQREYREKVWMKNLSRIKEKIRYELKGYEKNDYKGYLNHYRCNNKELIHLYQESSDSGVHIAMYIYMNREEITVSDLYELFEYIETCQLLETRILAFDVTGPPSGAYDDLFVNKACEQFMWKIELPGCNKSKYEYAALLFAMLDLGIAQKGKRSSTQFAAFVNKKFQEPVTADDIRKSRNKLINESFGSMTDEQLEERFDDTQREVLKNKYKEYYDILNSILNGEIECDDNTKWLISVIRGEVADF